MTELVPNFLAAFSAQDVARIRFISMFIVLLGGISAGYLAHNRFGFPEAFARKIMVILMAVFNWPIALLIIWPMHLSKELIWLPIAGTAILLIITALSWPLFLLHRLGTKSHLTIVLAGGMSNMGYTGGSFICYALFGLTGLALGHIYLLLWLPVVYFIFLPMLKIFQLRITQDRPAFSMSHFLDYRMLVIVAVIVAIILNLIGVKMPDWPVRLHIIDVLIYIAAALAFFAIGLRVTFDRLKNYRSLYFSLAMVKFLLTPAVAFVLLWLLALSGQPLSSLAKNVVMIQAVTPTAVMMVTISNVFDLDAPLASAVWVVSTAAFALLVAPVLFFIFL